MDFKGSQRPLASQNATMIYQTNNNMGHLAIFGGSSANRGKAQSEAYQIDLKTNTWARLEITGSKFEQPEATRSAAFSDGLNVQVFTFAGMMVGKINEGIKFALNTINRLDFGDKG